MAPLYAGCLVDVQWLELPRSPHSATLRPPSQAISESLSRISACPSSSVDRYRWNKRLKVGSFLLCECLVEGRPASESPAACVRGHITSFPTCGVQCNTEGPFRLNTHAVGSAEDESLAKGLPVVRGSLWCKVYGCTSTTCTIALTSTLKTRLHLLNSPLPRFLLTREHARVVLGDTHVYRQ